MRKDEIIINGIIIHHSHRCNCGGEKLPYFMNFVCPLMLIIVTSYFIYMVVFIIKEYFFTKKDQWGNPIE